MQYPIFSDEYYMNEALKEALKAFEKNEVPVGAVVVINNRIIARSYNMAEELNDVTAHAEMLAITSASNNLGSKYLTDCSLYVTLEPCAMCVSAMRWAQLRKLVYGAADPKSGFQQYGAALLHPKTEMAKGILENECSVLLSEFFESKRK